jgi:cell division protein FtsW
MVYSSSFIFAQERYKDGLYFFKRQFIFGGIGIAAFFAGLRLQINQLRHYAGHVLLLAAGFCILALLPGVGHKAGGASRWVNLFGLTFQPAEFAKLAVVIYVATQISKKIDRQDNWRTGFLTYFLGAAPLYLLLLLQPDFGSVALLHCTTVCMLFACGIRMRYLAVSAAVLVPTATALILTSAYRRARLFGFLDPWSDPARKGFQVIQSFLAFYSGKFFGVGLGNSREKLFYLPEAHNDFIFAVIGEELGLTGVIFFILLFLVVIWRGLEACSRLKQPFQRGLAAGITVLIGLQAFFNMGVVLGLLPTKGLPLPLISYGGSSLVLMLFMMGMLTQLSEKDR